MGPERLAHQHVALAAIQPTVKVGCGQPAQLELVGQLVREVAEGATQRVEGLIRQSAFWKPSRWLRHTGWGQHDLSLRATAALTAAWSSEQYRADDQGLVDDTGE